MAHFFARPGAARGIFATGQDYSRGARLREVFGVGPDGANSGTPPPPRKQINYGIIYGLSPFGLAQQIQRWPQKEAAQFINALFPALIQGVKKIPRQRTDGKRGQKNRSGRKRFFWAAFGPIPDITHYSPQVQISAIIAETHERLNSSAAKATAADLNQTGNESPIDRRPCRRKNSKAKMILQGGTNEASLRSAFETNARNSRN